MPNFARLFWDVLITTFALLIVRPVVDSIMTAIARSARAAA